MLQRLAIAVVIGLSGPAYAQGDAPAGDDHFAQLVHALANDDSFKVRLQAAVFLGRAKDPRAVEPLIQALRLDAHYTVRAAAATGLANLQHEEAIAEIFKASATDVDNFVREEALRALGKFSRPQVIPYATASYDSDDARLRLEAVRFLALDRPADAEQVLTRALGDEPEIAAVAVEAITRMEPGPRLAFLAKALDHREPTVRKGAVDALREVGDKDAAELILRVYERDIEVDQVREATRVALRNLRSHLPMTQIVDDALKHADKHVRARALKLLGVVGGSEAQSALLSTLEDKEVYLRGTAVMALRELGDPRSIPELEKLLSDPLNQRISLQIRTAVKHLRRRQAQN